mmetsp:Transcript_84631/g.239902  ORF Transcript_84631/g.239902 Transcript_84631/m.239902 type:complete len:204 (+) Transcript_84631:1205-1816(+)
MAALLGHNLGAPPIRNVNHTFDGLAQDPTQLDLSRWDRPVARVRGVPQKFHVRVDGAFRDQRARDLLVAVPRGIAQGREAEVVALVHVRAHVEEPLHGLEVPLGRRHVQRRAAVVVACADICTSGKKRSQCRDAPGRSCLAHPNAVIDRLCLLNVVLPGRVAPLCSGKAESRLDVLVAALDGLVKSGVAPAIRGLHICLGRNE